MGSIRPSADGRTADQEQESVPAKTYICHLKDAPDAPSDSEDSIHQSNLDWILVLNRGASTRES